MKILVAEDDTALASFLRKGMESDFACHFPNESLLLDMQKAQRTGDCFILHGDNH